MTKRVQIEFQFLSQTETQIHVEDLDGVDYWLPKSQLESDDWDTYSEGEDIEVDMPQWLAEEEGIL